MRRARPAPPPSTARRAGTCVCQNRGFTLIELLVVVFIIGITAGFAVIAISGRAVDDRLENEARRLEQLLRLASEEAVIQGIEVGFLTDGTSYTFLELGEQGWSGYPDEGPLRPRDLPEGMELTLAVDEFDLPPAQKAKKDGDAEEENELTPQIYFLSSGELSPFDLELIAEGARRRYRLTAKLTGEIEFKPLDSEAKLAPPSRPRDG